MYAPSIGKSSHIMHRSELDSYK